MGSGMGMGANKGDIAMISGARVQTPRGLAVFERQDGDEYLVRLINTSDWPFPEWVRFRRSQLRLVRPPKKTVENYGEALY